MSTTAIQFESLIPYIHAHLPGCPQGLMMQHIREIVIEFCERTQVWQYDLDPISVASGVAAYELYGIPDHSVIQMVTDARLSGRCLRPIYDYVMQAKDVLALTWTPSADVENGLTIKVALKPCPDASSIDDCVFHRVWKDWHMGISFGVLASLQRIPKKDWTDLQHAEINFNKYVTQRSRASIEVKRQLTNATMMARTPRAFAFIPRRR